MSTVLIHRDGSIATITINRPEVRNAVDGLTAQALAEAFREFEDDYTLSVAILTGSANTFCAGADLKAIAEGRGNEMTDNGDGPMGPTRMMLSKPVIAAVATPSLADSNSPSGATSA